MREPLTPYKGPNVLNYLCIISTELLGENLPAMTLIGVTRLAFPELKVEIEATAAK